MDTDTIGAFKQTPNRAGEFVPLPPEQIEAPIQALVTYIRTGLSYRPLVDIALIHYQFETIHPTGDGTLYGVWNGKDGRHWQDEAVVVECRSPKIELLLKRDRSIVEAFER